MPTFTGQQKLHFLASSKGLLLMKTLTHSQTVFRRAACRIANDDSTLSQSPRRRLATPKPFTIAELQARSHGETYLQLAQTYRDSHDILNAVSCCLEGLALTFGISRPLAVRDQLHDLLDNLDPLGTVSSQLKLCLDYISLQRDENVTTARQTSRPAPTNLETLISAHQLLTYPSEYRRFNRTYEAALACLKQNPSVCELYILQYRTKLGALRHNGEIHFPSFLPD
jgi:hypothetical protein